MEATLAIANRIAGNGPLAVRLAFEIEAYNRLVPTKDRREGVLEFNEGRKPNFQGR